MELTESNSNDQRVADEIHPWTALTNPNIYKQNKTEYGPFPSLSMTISSVRSKFSFTPETTAAVVEVVVELDVVDCF